MIYKRLLEEKIQKYLNNVGGLCIVGSRFVGKSFTGNLFAKQVYNLLDEDQNSPIYQFPKDYLMKSQFKPILIDEWQLKPDLWNIAKSIIDKKSEHGLFIFTGSLWINQSDLIDPAVGRFGYIKLRPLTLFEANKTCKLVSLLNLCNDSKFEFQQADQKYELKDLINACLIGGYPFILNANNNSFLQYRTYLDSTYKLLKMCKLNLSKNTFENILIYCAKKIGKNYTLKTETDELTHDDKNNEIDFPLPSRKTVYRYLKTLEDLYLIDRLHPFDTNIAKNDTNLIKEDKLYFNDPAIALNLLHFNEQQILQNLNSFGFYFENLVYKELITYADYYDAKLYYFGKRPNLDIDFIMQFQDGSFVAIEAKLSNNDFNINNSIKKFQAYKTYCLKQKAKEKAKKHPWNINREWLPKKCIVITGTGNVAYKTNDDIYIVPIFLLKP